MSKFPSELRYDIVSKDWVVIATGRAKRPEMFRLRRKKGLPKEKCPFCKIETQKKPLLAFSQGKELPLPQEWHSGKKKGKELTQFLKEWTTIVIPNLYPAFIREEKPEKRKEGELYFAMDAVGSHEVVITRNHET